MLLLRSAFFFFAFILCSSASLVDLDFSSRNPRSIDPSQLEGLYLLQRGEEMKPRKQYISMEQLPSNTRVIKERERYTREIRPDRLTIFINGKGRIIKVGAFK